MTKTLKQVLMGSDPVAQLKLMRGNGTLRTLEPTLADLKMSIPAGYHHKDNLEHSFQVLQNAIDREVNGPDLVLRTAALFHDIGKPATREFGERGVVTFTNHDFVGAKIVKRVLPQHGFSKNEVRQISVLVALHMRSHTFENGWSDSAVRRLVTDAGDQVQLDRLVILFYSDATTKFDAKKAGIHASVDALVAELVRVRQKDERAALRPALNGLEVAEFLGIAPGPQLGKAMKLLNTDENVRLNRDEAFALLRATFL